MHDKQKPILINIEEVINNYDQPVTVSIEEDGHYKDLNKKMNENDFDIKPIKYNDWKNKCLNGELKQSIFYTKDDQGNAVMIIWDGKDFRYDDSIDGKTSAQFNV